MTTPDTDPLDAPTAALAAAILEVSRHVDSESFPAPRWFALARSSELLASQPGLAALLGDDTARSEERRVGKECRSRGWMIRQKRKEEIRIVLKEQVNQYKRSV